MCHKSGTVTISDATVTTSGTASSRGLYATYGGTITASGVTISTMWKSCATLSTDRGGGTVSCTGCTLSTMDSGSPFIYSGGTTSIITVSGTTGRQSASQCVVVEGKNTAIVQDRSNLKCTGKGNTGDADNSGIFLYQSMSGDADVGTTTFTCTNSKFEIDSYSSIYDSVPIFSITNTAAAINLEGCTFKYGSGTFLSVTKNSAGWGTSGSNGGNVTLTLTNQDIEGDFIIDSCSSLTIKMINSSIIGAINTWNTSTNVAVILDADSSLNLTGDSYISSYTNEDTTGSNINKGSYIFADNYGNDWITTESSTSASTTTVSTITVSTTTFSTTSNNSENPISNYDKSLYILLGKTIAIATVAFMLLLLLFLLKNFIKSIFE